MFNVSHPTEVSVRGPFLLNESELHRLDEVIDSVWKELGDGHEAELQDGARGLIAEIGPYEGQELQATIEEIRDHYPYSQSERSVTVRFRSGRSITCETFQEIRRTSDVADETPTAFSVSLVKGEISASIESGDARVFSQGLKISVSSGTGQSQRAKAAFHNWAISARSPVLTRLWARVAADRGILILGVMCLLLVWSYFATNFGERDNGLAEYQALLKSEAAILLEDGQIDDEERRTAELILLSLSSDYLPATAQQSSRGLTVGLGVALTAIVTTGGLLFIRKHLALAIGKGTQQVGRWTMWYKVATLTIPGLLGLEILAPLVSRLLRSVL